MTGLLMAISLEEKLEVLEKDNAKGYLSPFVNVIGTGLNSGLYNSAKTLTPIIGFNLKISAVLIPIPDSDKIYYAKAPKAIDPLTGKKIWEDVETATIFGGKGTPHAVNSVVKEAFIAAGKIPPDPFKSANGSDFSVLPLPCASLSWGLPFGNEVLIRYMPPIKPHEEVGDIQFYGFGLKHDLIQWLPISLPVLDVAAQFVFQNFKAADILEISTKSINLHASATLPIVSIYGGLGYESANLEASYTVYDVDADGEKISDNFKKESLKISSENDFKATAGLKFSILPFVNVYGDYSVAKYNSIHAGIGIGF